MGRIGPDWTVGALSALTGTNSLQFVNTTTGRYANRLAAPATAFNVLRLKRELGGAGHVGLIGTAANGFEGDRTYPTDAAHHGHRSSALRGRRLRSVAAAFTMPTSAAPTPAGGHRPPTTWPRGAFIQSYVAGGPTQPVPELDGTVIGPGSTGSGGWLRVAKEGGRHLLWSAEYTGASRKLQYNDVGYMARQNLHHGKAALGWRTLDVGTYTLETTSALEVSDNRNLVGPRSRHALRAQHPAPAAQLLVGAPGRRLRPFAFRRSRGRRRRGPASSRDIGAAGSSSTPIHAGDSPASLSNQTQILARRRLRHHHSGRACSFMRCSELDLELIPLARWTAGEYRYIRQVTSATDYYFGKLETKNASATLRATYTFTPQLTLQAYAQAFLAFGTFTDSKSIGRSAAGASPVGTKITLANLAAAPAVSFAGADNPDFEDAAINLNLVLRWEYRLGATLYLVYTHSQIPTVPLTDFAPPAGSSPSAFGHGQTSDVVLLKLSYWWAS